MTSTPPEGRGPGAADDLLRRARARGESIRRRRLALRSTAAAIAAGGLAVALAVTLPSGNAVHRVGTAAPGSTTTAARPRGSTAPTSTPGSTSTAVAASSTSAVVPSTASKAVPPPPVTTTTVAAPVTLTLTDTDSGRTVTVPDGSTVIVKLAADNWTIHDSSDPAVLAMQGAPAQQRADCGYPGGTCGSTRATFRADSAGRATVTAGRSYCGEAIRCTPKTGAWSVTVVVTG